MKEQELNIEDFFGKKEKIEFELPSREELEKYFPINKTENYKQGILDCLSLLIRLVLLIEKDDLEGAKKKIEEYGYLAKVDYIQKLQDAVSSIDTARIKKLEQMIYDYSSCIECKHRILVKSEVGCYPDCRVKGCEKGSLFQCKLD